MLIGGLLLSLVAIVVATLIDGNSFGVLLGPSSFVLVFFGTLGAALTAYAKNELLRMPKVAVKAFRGELPDVDGTVTTLASLAEVARREGMLALESRLEGVEDPFLRAGMQLLVDGSDAEQISDLLQIDIAALDDRHQVGVSFFKSLGAYAPTFGMLGTVIGLINMLQNLTDPAQLGIGMALALLTTLYGVLLANAVFLPIANKLGRLNDAEIAAREVTVDGILAIQAGQSPRLLVERLETYLPTAMRVGHAARAAATASTEQPRAAA